MNDTSRPVTSTQQGCHKNLATLVARHLSRPHQRPPAEHTRHAFDRIRSSVEKKARPIIFDSFCGTGMSTAMLADQHSDAIIIGIDKSAHRLGKHDPEGEDNYHLVHADCGDFWRLAADAGWSLSGHYILYPNPWPKPGHLQRRVHGSADLVALLLLGGKIELRSNWNIYVEEFGLALQLAGNTPVIDLLTETEPLTLFERKYRDSGHELWRCRCTVKGGPGAVQK